MVDSKEPKQQMDSNHKVLGSLFLGGVTGVSVLFGFGIALGMAKKKDASFFQKGLMANSQAKETGSSLALRALGWGTLYAVSGFGLFCFAVKKALGVESLEQFRFKVGSMLPVLSKKEHSGRTEFASISELFIYLANEDQKTSDTSDNKASKT